jgi:hypothetical protein
MALFTTALTATSVATTTAQPSAAATPASVAIQPAIKDLLASPSGPVDTTQCEALFSLACYEPAQVQNAYDEKSLFARGVTGRGQTIAIVDAFGSPTIAADLATFDAAFNLPAPPSFRIIQPAGPVPAFQANNTTIAWASETTLDVEWAHVMAPGANILLVETPVAETEGTTGFPQIVQAENYVIDHHLAGIISQSFSATESTLPQGLRFLYPLRSSFVNAFYRDVTVLASSGDYGATEPVNSDGTELSTSAVTTWPASDPLVTGVGGTQLHLSATTGARTAPDSVWNDSNDPAVAKWFYRNAGPNAAASGGGLSTEFPRPRYQSSDAKVVGKARGVPDVSMSAACDGAVDVYESFPGISQGWYLSCGTSESTPLFAGIVALADQVAHRPLGLINPALYELSEEHARGITDITSGNNTVSFHQGNSLVTVPGHAAQRGYDLVSGVGTIDAAHFVPELVAAVTHRRHDHGPPPCDAQGSHGTDAASGYGGDSHRCCPDPHGVAKGLERCCPDPDGWGQPAHGCGDPGGQDGWPGPHDPGQATGTGVVLSAGPAGPIGPAGASVAPSGANAASASGLASGPSVAGGQVARTGPSSSVPAQAIAGSGSVGTQPSTSSSTSSSAPPGPAGLAAGGPGTASGTGSVSLVVPAGVLMGAPAAVDQLLRR